MCIRDSSVSLFVLETFYFSNLRYFRFFHLRLNNPTRWGLDVWFRCDSITDFCHQLDIYLGRDQYRRASVGQAVVEKLTKGSEGKNFHDFYDSFFTSIFGEITPWEKNIFLWNYNQKQERIPIGFEEYLSYDPRRIFHLLCIRCLFCFESYKISNSEGIKTIFDKVK